MRRIFSVIAVAFISVCIVYAQSASFRDLHAAEVTTEKATVASQTSRSSDTYNNRPQDDPKPAKQKRKVDIMADDAFPYYGGGDSVTCFVGNFAAHHNGAVISCDSAVRYGDMRMGFFRNVVINQDSVYIYGDSAIYYGESNLAEVYAPIVKVVDGAAMLYTYNFSFDTEQKTGHYTGGGVLVHDNDIMESQRGYYDATTHDITSVEQVELHGSDYDMKSDSVIYNAETDQARFFANSEIWNADGDYLAADEGLYDNTQDLYKITRNGYILTSEREMWGDTLSYYRTAGHIIARRNIQMDDFKNKILAFGNYAEHWNEAGNSILTDEPAIISYDTLQGDSVFMRADSMLLFTISRRAEAEAKAKAEAERIKDSVSLSNSKAANAAAPNGSALPTENKIPRSNSATTDKTVGTDKAATDKATDAQQASEDAVADNELTDKTIDTEDDYLDTADSTARDTIQPLSKKELKAAAREKEKKAALEIKKAKAAERKILLDSIAAKRQAKITEQLEKQRLADLDQAVKDSLRRAVQRAKLVSRGRDVTLLDSLDSMANIRTQRIRDRYTPTTPADDHDSRYTDANRTVSSDEAHASKDSLAAIDTMQLDSTYRLAKAYRSVRMYRTDAQMVCDSMVSNSTDSIVHLYINPVLWNNSNQITSDLVDIYTKNRQIVKADFVGSPIMVAEVDTAYYNQVSGKAMTAFFRDNEIYRDDVTGNVQTIYFQREDEQSTQVTEMIYIESASASFYIENKELTGMTYRNDVPFKLYPIAQIPPTQEMKLKNFKWVPSLRPTRESIFNLPIRPSVREQRALRERPKFDIVEKMDRYKEKLLRSGSWVDREDELRPEVIEWRDSREL